MTHNRLSPQLRFFSVWTALIVFLIGAGPPALRGKTLTLIAFGDSTTAPRDPLVVYPTLLEKALIARGLAVKVVNAGVRGNNTSDAAKRFQKDVLDQQPDLVILQFGINDSAIDVWKQPPEDRPRVALEEFNRHLRFFVTTLRSRRAKAILMTPNPLRWTPRLRELYGKPPYDLDNPDGINQFLKRYAEAVKSIARLENVPLIDVAEAFRDYARENGSLDDLLLDGVHPNQQGHRIVAELLRKTILDLFGLQ